MMKKQGGFTLIELVVVIVILGILAVTAAPRFLDLQGDARESALEGLGGAMNGAASIVYGKSAILGEEKDPSGEAEEITTKYGYPAVTADGAGIVEAVTGLDDDTQWTTKATVSDTNTVAGTLVATFADSTLDDAAAVIATKCYVTYTEATDTTDYTVAVTDASGC